MDKKLLFLLIISIALLLVVPSFANSNETTLINTGPSVGGDRDEHGCIPSAGYTWCEEKQKCLRVWEEECPSLEKDNPNRIQNRNCVCTKEYEPVCGKNGETYGNACMANCEQVEIAYRGKCKDPSPNCICTMEYAPVCGVNGRTYGNACAANCEKVEIAYKGECKNTNSFDRNYVHSVDGNVDSNKYERDIKRDSNESYLHKCEEIATPICDSNQLLVEKINARGCKELFCVLIKEEYNTNSRDYSPQNPNSEFYFGANWVCSNQKVYREKSNKWMPIAYWKEEARKICSQFSIEKCFNNNDSNEVNTNTKESKNKGEKCVNSAVSVETIEFTNPCRPNCKVIIDEEGCKNISCDNGNIERYCEKECRNQTLKEIRLIKEKCASVNGEVIVTNQNNCLTYICDKIPFNSDDFNLNDLNYVDSVKEKDGFVKDDCISLGELPQSKYVFCEEQGGRLLVKTNNDGCVVLAECVEKSNKNSNKINKEILNDSTKLLELALKLEELKLELNKISLKIKGVSNYYGEIGDTNYALKFNESTELLSKASVEIDSIKSIIKNRVNNFDEKNALVVREKINGLKKNYIEKTLIKLLD